MRSWACWQSMNLFRWPGVSVINTASILCYMKVSFRTFEISSNMYFLNDLGKTWSHGRRIIESSIALFSKSLTLPKVYAFILPKVLIALMGFQRLCMAFYTETAHVCTHSQLYDVCHAWYVVPQCGPLDTRGLNCWMQLPCHRSIGGSIISCNSKQPAVGKLTMIECVLQMHVPPCFCILAFDISLLISFQTRKRTGNQPQWEWDVLHVKPNFDPYSMQWPQLWRVC